MLYRICGLVFRSNLPLPELVPASGGPVYGEFCLGDQEPSAKPLDWLHQWRAPNGELRVSLARRATGYVLCFPEGVEFFVDADGRRISCWAARGVAADTLRHLLLDQVVPLALSRRFLLLHAGAVATARGAVAFLSGSGGGKSTLTASFCATGVPHLADDCLRVERDGTDLLAVPAYPGLRLWENALEVVGRPTTVSRVADFNNKKRVRVGGDGLPFCADAVPLRAAYLLEPTDHGDAGAIRPLPARAAAMTLVAHSYRLDVTDRAALVREMDAIDALVRRLPVCRLAYPWNFTELARVHRAILDHLETL